MTLSTTTLFWKVLGMTVLPCLDTFREPSQEQTIFVVLNPINFNPKGQTGRLKMKYRSRDVQIVSVPEAVKNMVAVQVGRAVLSFPVEGTIFMDKVMENV